MSKGPKYKLYRELKEIFHPSISRQNISNYQIILKNQLLPISIFYPKKEVVLDHIIIYITDSSCEFAKDLALYTNHLVFVLEKGENDFFHECYEVINYIYDNIEKHHILKKHITIMSDSSTDILEKILVKSKKTKDFYSSKNIFLGFYTKLKVDKNQLFIPNIHLNYSFYSKNQVFEIINQFLV